MPSFGYSVGDCIASLDLLARIIKSLRETSGASSEFQRLQIDLDFLREVLAQLNIANLISTNASAEQTAKAVKFVQSSQATISALLDKLSKFKGSLAVGATSGKSLSALRKAQWALMYSEDVAKLRQVLVSQTTNLALFLEAQNIEFTRAIALDLSTSQDQVASATASQASSLRRLEASMSGLSRTVKDRSRTWENDQKFQYRDMIRKLAEVEDNIRKHISNSYEDHRSALSRFVEETTAQRNSHQQALHLVAGSIKEQNSILGLEFDRLNNSISAKNEKMVSLCENLRPYARALEEATRDVCQHQQHQRSRLVNDGNLGLKHRFDSAEVFPDSECQDISSITSLHVCQTDGQRNLAMSDMESFIANLVSSIIIGIWVMLWNILRAVFLRFRRLEYSATLYNYPKPVITDCIQLFDALGGVRTLQYDVCRNWRTFNLILRDQFKRRPGYRKVKTGEFVLLDLQRNIILPKTEEWSHSISPGLKIAMSMVITELEITKGKCPSPLCGASIKAKRGQVIVKCPGCELKISLVRRISPEFPEDRLEITESSDRKWNKKISGPKVVTLRTSRRLKSARLTSVDLRKALEIRELSSYRRIHICESVSQKEYFPKGLWPVTHKICPVCSYERCSTCWYPGDLYRWSIVPADMWVCCDCHV